jgi:hypothetical protein
VIELGSNWHEIKKQKSVSMTDLQQDQEISSPDLWT